MYCLRMIFGYSRKKLAITLAVLGVLVLLAVLTTRFNFKWHFEGLFLLKGRDGKLLELKNDLYLGDGSRLIYGIDLDNPKFEISNFFGRHKKGETYLYYEWDNEEGNGFVRSFFPGGKQILACFGRYDYSEDAPGIRGLFVGGGLPSSVHGDSIEKMDETGMAYYDGFSWRHVWCNVNEGIASATTLKKVPPTEWKFLGSSVLNESENSLAIKSSHEIMLDGTPLRMDRFAYFRAGNTYFILSINIKNTGSTPASYYYIYGDEPWVGNFGSSRGNVGWVSDRLVKYEEWLDTKKYSFAGFFDYGNDAIGEGHAFTMTANFIEWLGKSKPLVYFSNGPDSFPDNHARPVPLCSDERFIGLQWGPVVLRPGETEKYVLAIGMAGLDPKTGFPVKPGLQLYRSNDPKKTASSNVLAGRTPGGLLPR